MGIPFYSISFLYLWQKFIMKTLKFLSALLVCCFALNTMQAQTVIKSNKNKKVVVKKNNSKKVVVKKNNNKKVIVKTNRHNSHGSHHVNTNRG